MNSVIDREFASLIFSVRPRVGMTPPMDSRVEAGDKLALMCTLTKGDPPITFQWLKDGKLVENIDGVKVESQEDISLMVLSGTVETSTGNYTCVATNPVGASFVTTEIFVNGNFIGICLVMVAGGEEPQ